MCIRDRGGALGKRLYLRANDIYQQNEKPFVQADSDLKSIIIEISSKRLGVTAVLDEDKLIGIITDGDLRRMLSKEAVFQDLKARDIMSKDPIIIEKDVMAIEAVKLMRSNNISQLIVADGNTYLGVIHFHDLLKEGLI